MIFAKLQNLISYERRKCDSNTRFCQKLFHKTQIQYKILKRDSSVTRSEQSKNVLWHGILRRWKWIIPIGSGLSIFTVWQWRHFHGHSHAVTGKDEIVNEFVVSCYYCLPLRVTSRIWGWLASREIPISLRSKLYGFYAKTFHANLDEVGSDLSTFPSLVEFFVRPLKSDVRPIAQNTNIVSPADGTVLHFGPVTSCKVEQIKGVTYNLIHFLGDIDWPRPDRDKNCLPRNYLKALLQNPDNQLYQLVVYLSPGDYHRFHSPADWQIEFRRHFRGKLLSVSPTVLKYMPDLFSLNERVVYIGSWAGGFMAYIAVGATNVGSIKVYCDRDLATNRIKWPESHYANEVKLNNTRVTKGQEFGEFRMGSTIVLLFEAPKDFHFDLKEGQRIKTGEALTDCFVNSLHVIKGHNASA